MIGNEPLFGAACGICGKLFDPDVVYASFRDDYTARTGWAFTGRAPDWVRSFCSEGCRYVDVEQRAAAQNAKTRRRNNP